MLNSHRSAGMKTQQFSQHTRFFEIPFKDDNLYNSNRVTWLLEPQNRSIKNRNKAKKLK